MKKSVIAVTAAAVMGFGGSALAGSPTVLTDDDMDQIIAGGITASINGTPVGTVGTGRSGLVIDADYDTNTNTVCYSYTLPNGRTGGNCGG